MTSDLVLVQAVVVRHKQSGLDGDVTEPLQELLALPGVTGVVEDLLQTTKKEVHL